MKTKHKLHTADLNNNCPICYNDNGLCVSFFQIEEESTLYTKIEKEVSEVVFCKNCEQQVYPVQWTKDIELVYDYHYKQVVPIKPGLRFKKKGKFLLAVLVLSVSAGAIALIVLS